MKRIELLKDMAIMLRDALYSDRDALIGVGGMTGEGKSVFMIQLVKEFCKATNQNFSFDCMTWERAELLERVDGVTDGEQPKFNGQMPEYSPTIADELISMFYKRNWFEEDQKASVELFNKCRDRHQLIIGGVPNFWDLDGGMLCRFRFYIFIPFRGIAWVFQQENNPFASDAWNILENRKIFRKNRDPYKCPNFAFEVRYDDLDSDEKSEYLALRNTKRKNTENQNKKEAPEKYGKIKAQRDAAIRLAHQKGGCTQVSIAAATGLSRDHISKLCNNVVT